MRRGGYRAWRARRKTSATSWCPPPQPPNGHTPRPRFARRLASRPRTPPNTGHPPTPVGRGAERALLAHYRYSLSLTSVLRTDSSLGGALKRVEHISITVFGTLKNLDLSDGFGGKIAH